MSSERNVSSSERYVSWWRGGRAREGRNEINWTCLTNDMAVSGNVWTLRQWRDTERRLNNADGEVREIGAACCQPCEASSVTAGEVDCATTCVAGRPPAWRSCRQRARLTSDDLPVTDDGALTE